MIRLSLLVMLPSTAGLVQACTGKDCNFRIWRVDHVYLAVRHDPDIHASAHDAKRLQVDIRDAFLTAGGLKVQVSPDDVMSRVTMTRGNRDRFLSKTFCCFLY